MVPVAMSISGYVLEADALKLQQSMLNVAQNAADAQAPKAEPDDDAEMTDEELSGLRPVNEVPEVANALNKKNPT
jgi:C4-dicarboxylate-specific signal transduction histidine kinase